MAVTYDYETGRMTRDFHFVRYGEICRLSGLPAYVGGNRCKHCPCNDGYVDSCSFGVEHWQDFDGSYIRCKHSEAKDSENIGDLLRAYYDFIQHRALCALCY